MCNFVNQINHTSEIEPPALLTLFAAAFRHEVGGHTSTRSPPPSILPLPCSFISRPFFSLHSSKLATLAQQPMPGGRCRRHDHCFLSWQESHITRKGKTTSVCSGNGTAGALPTPSSKQTKCISKTYSHRQNKPRRMTIMCPPMF